MLYMPAWPILAYFRSIFAQKLTKMFRGGTFHGNFRWWVREVTQILTPPCPGPPWDTHTKSSKRRQAKQSQFDSYKKSDGVRGLTDHDYEDESKK